MNLYTFMGDHPILTIVLALLVCETICTGFKAWGKRRKDERP